MSDTTTEVPVAAPEPAYGDPVSKSEVGEPNGLDGSAAAPEPKAEPEPKTEAEAKTPDVEKKPRQEDWRETRLRQQNARISAEARRGDDLHRQLEELKAQLPKTETQPPAAADFERAVQERASQIDAQKTAQAEQQAFAADCNTIAGQGSKEFGEDFLPTIKTLWEATDGTDANGNLTPRAVALIEAAMETEKPHAVLHYLGQNPDEAIRIASMKSDAKRGAAIAKMAATLTTKAANALAETERPRPVSRAPAPMEPVSGAARTDTGALGPKDIGAWMKWEADRVKTAGGKR